MRRRRRLVLIAALGVALAGEAGATFSVVMVDRESSRMGMAAASCTGRLAFADGMAGIWHAAPGKGVFAAQGFARMFPKLRARGVELLSEGLAPAEVVATLLREHPREMQTTQLGIVDLRGRRASHTGAGTSGYACDAARQSCGDPRFAGAVGPRVYSIQGNMLTGAPVLEGMAGGVAAGGCDLAETLMRMLEGGARDGDGKVRGDARCAIFGSPGDAALLRVAGSDGTAILDLRVDAVCRCDPLCVMPPCANPQGCTCPDADAVGELRARYDAWRATHPCPEAAP